MVVTSKAIAVPSEMKDKSLKRSGLKISNRREDLLGSDEHFVTLSSLWQKQTNLLSTNLHFPPDFMHILHWSLSKPQCKSISSSAHKDVWVLIKMIERIMRRKMRECGWRRRWRGCISFGHYTQRKKSTQLKINYRLIKKNKNGVIWFHCLSHCGNFQIFKGKWLD